MIEGHLYLFPLSVCILIPFAYFLSFLVAVHLNHTQWEFPFISRSSTDAPESCLYAQLINFASFILIITVYIRHRQIAELIRNNPTCGIKYSQLNFSFLFSGIFAAFGMSIIANFPHVNVFLVRIIATYITLITSVASVYCEMLLSFWIRPLLYSRRILPIVRTVLTMICTFALIVFLIFQTIDIVVNKNHMKTWTENERGWTCHFVTLISQWILTSTILIYISSLIPDFYRIKIISPKIFLSNDIVDDRANSFLSITT